MKSLSLLKDNGRESESGNLSADSRATQLSDAVGTNCHSSVKSCSSSATFSGFTTANSNVTGSATNTFASTQALATTQQHWFNGDFPTQPGLSIGQIGHIEGQRYSNRQKFQTGGAFLITWKPRIVVAISTADLIAVLVATAAADVTAVVVVVVMMMMVVVAAAVTVVVMYYCCYCYCNS